MIPINKPKYYISLFLFLIILFIISIIIQDIKIDRKYGHYKEIISEITINSLIIKIERDSRGYPFITLEDNKYYWVNRAINYNYNPYEIFDFLQVGDSLSKTRNSDTIYIYRAGKEFEFKFNSVIEKK